MAATVYSKKVNGPATHALLIGVGHYPHLPGGSGKHKFANDDGMGQLASPPESARAVARWLIENYDSPNRPLSSVMLLTSEKKAENFEYVLAGKKKTVPVAPAEMPAIEQAILAWRNLGDKNVSNLLIFYFCGHGIAAGTELALLLSDFGAKDLQPLNGAIDFRKLHSNMDECAARNQCYFIDACRVGSDLLERNDGFAGNPVVQATGNMTNPNGDLRIAPIFYSTLANAEAYAKVGDVSVFTKALLDCFKGAGSGDETGPWEVQATMLQRALGKLMLQASHTLKMPQAQIAASDSFAELTLNTLASPIVPVFVEVVPAEAHAKALLRCEGAVKDKRPPKPEPWRLSVPVGKYSFFADFKSGNLKVTPYVDEIVRPPLWSKPLKVVP